MWKELTHKGFSRLRPKNLISFSPAHKYVGMQSFHSWRIFFLHNFYRENIEYRPPTYMHSLSCLQQFQGFQGLFFFLVNSDILILGSVLEGLDKPFV